MWLQYEERLDWLFSCNDPALPARCLRHLQTLFNLIVDIFSWTFVLLSIDSCKKVYACPLARIT